MTKKLENVLKEVLENITPEENKIKFMQDTLDYFLIKINKRIKKLKIDAEIFVGGSFAKGTIIKKGAYDVDLFLRFDKKYSQFEYIKLSKKILRWTSGVSIVHGSRDYFKVKINSWFYLEIIPVKKIKNPKEAVNTTDLSYAHVNYITKKVKKKELIEGIKLGKAFCHATKTYGAESYVNGFSGYSIELLILHFGSFEKFLKNLSKNQKKKLVIDIENLYRKGNVLLDMNASKLESPIILIDPTYKIRNALAALSDKTFAIFQSKAKDFLKNPTKDFFQLKKTDIEELKKKAKEEKLEFILIKTKTKKQAGDIAGTKLLKFHNHLKNEFNKYFEIKENGFDYLGDKFGRSYFSLKKRNEILFIGPEEKDKKNAENFKIEHKKTFIEYGRLYAKKKINVLPTEFLKNWIIKNKKKIKEMYISNLKFS